MAHCRVLLVDYNPDVAEAQQMLLTSLNQGAPAGSKSPSITIRNLLKTNLAPLGADDTSPIEVGLSLTS